MAASNKYLEYIKEKLSELGEFTYRSMMGEYCVYSGNKLVAEICDDRLLLKPTKSLDELLPDAQRVYPYEGAKSKLILFDKTDDVELLSRALKVQFSELPERKTRPAAQSKYTALWKWISNQSENSIKLKYAEIEQMAGVPVDHSFLKYKRELEAFGWRVEKISMKEETILFMRNEQT